jgi:hypothetical protein
VRQCHSGLSLIPWTEDASRFQLALASGAMLGECRVGRGRIVVCTLHVLDGVRRGYPEAGYMLDCLVGYAAGGLPPTTLPELSLDDAKKLFVVEPKAAK